MDTTMLELLENMLNSFTFQKLKSRLYEGTQRSLLMFNFLT